MYLNDEYGSHQQTPESRFASMKRWIENNLAPVADEPAKE
jgi:hypothetical protein